LCRYADDRNTLIAKLRKCHEKVGINFPRLDFDGNARDIDPFSVFGLFNKGISTANRIRLIASIKDEFGVKSDVPELFNGVPVLNNMMSCFFAYSNDARAGKDDIGNLWRIFKSAINFADGGKEHSEEFVNCWDKVVKQFGVKWNLTMGLYWIRPYCFVNLDRINRNYISRNATLANAINSAAPRVLAGTVPSGRQYLDICGVVAKEIEDKTIDCESLPEFSYLAWLDGQKTWEGKVGGRRIWLCAPGRGGCAWDDCREHGYICLGWNELGDLSEYSSKDEMYEKLGKARTEGGPGPKNSSLACWQFSHELAVGDIVIAKAGLHKLLGVGVVDGDYLRDEERADYKNIVPCRWVSYDEKTYNDQLPVKTLTEITEYPEVVHAILAELYGLDPDTLKRPDDAGDEDDDQSGEEYSKTNFLSEVFMSEDEYERIRRLLLAKKNIIFQGAPGVGKTYAARRFAASIAGSMDSGRVKLVQFHQNYSYEDFIGGFKPDGGGFAYRTGVFYDFCRQAKEDSDGRYFFIIDEINRGNLSKIFGELLMLIEPDKRNEDVRLAYTGEPFFVPDNVYIIGMMNTADRSLAMIDYALRRRFSFVTLRPQLKNPKFEALLAKNSDPGIKRLAECVCRLNEVIRNDVGLGEGFEIGHSYFCGRNLNAADIVEFELKPLLKEYWYDDMEKVEEWSLNLDRSIG
jgi:5-methylcytosine-specific restriction protein B